MRGSFLWMIPILLAGTTAQDGKNVYLDKSLGFRIRRPASSWLFQIDRTKRNSELILTLFQKGSDRGLKFIVAVSNRGKTPDTRKAFDRAEKALKASAVYSDVKSGKTVVAGMETAFLSYVEKKRVSVRLYFLSRNERLYSLYAKAPRDNDWKTLSRILKSFEFVEVDETVHKLAARCGSELEWADDWKDAARRAKKGKRLILVAIQHVQKSRYGDSVRSGPFMDPDLADLVRERFVLVELTKGMDAPFKEGYLGPWPSGLVILFATPQGRVLRDTFSFNASYLYSLALQVLGEHPQYAGSPAPNRRDKLALAETCLKRGELARAKDILKTARTARGFLLQAALFRRLRLGDAALAALEKVKGMKSDVMMDEGWILARMGRPGEARKVLTLLIRKHPKSKRIPEATYLLGTCRRMLGEFHAAKAEFEKLTRSHPDNRWAWKAAAHLTVWNFVGTRKPRVPWPAKEILAAALRPREASPLKISAVAQAQRDSEDFLLKNQRPDGSWIVPVQMSMALPAWSLAVTSICAQSLLPLRDRPEAAKAVQRALAYLFRARTQGRWAPDRKSHTPLDIWGQIFTLQFLAACRKGGIGSAEKFVPAMNELVTRIAVNQTRDGGWHHKLFNDISENKGPPSVAGGKSFITAPVVISLLAARKSGAKVPERILEKALHCLRSMRNGDGSFIYEIMNGRRGGKWGNAADAGRSPLCALALYRGKKGDLKGVRRALDFFVQHHDALNKERGKALVHAGPQGQGSHFISFDYAYAAAAVRLLPKNERAAYRTVLLEDILGARLADGSYTEQPWFGRAYAAAMALMAFQELTEGRAR